MIATVVGRSAVPVFWPVRSAAFLYFCSRFFWAHPHRPVRMVLPLFDSVTPFFERFCVADPFSRGPPSLRLNAFSVCVLTVVCQQAPPLLTPLVGFLLSGFGWFALRFPEGLRAARGSRLLLHSSLPPSSFLVDPHGSIRPALLR